MHTKIKGNIGQLATALYFAGLGYAIFTEQGDNSKIDLIAEKDGTYVRVQCKALTPKKGVLQVPMTKAGPGYRFRYEQSMFDFFAVYDLVHKGLYLIPASILATHRKQLTITIDDPKFKV